MDSGDYHRDSTKKENYTITLKKHPEKIVGCSPRCCIGIATAGVVVVCLAAFGIYKITQITKIHENQEGNVSYLTQIEGDSVKLSCPGTFTFPEWRGPPSLTLYTNQDDQSGTINTKAQAANRLKYASNNRDLILSNAVSSDSGDYKCTYTGKGDYLITLRVNAGAAIQPVEKSYTASVGDDVQLTWSYDDENQMFSVDWTFQTDTAATPENIMAQSFGSPAVAENNYNVEHGGNGIITLKSITMESFGIYFCVVSYNLVSFLPPVTGTATLKVYV